MPSPVDKYYKEVKDSNPSYSDEQAWATAWSVFCKHVEPGSEHCHKPTSEYLKGKSAMSPLRDFQDAVLIRNVIARFVGASKSGEATKHFESMKGLKSKVENADPSAKKKFDLAYDKLFESGESAAKTAEKLVKKSDDVEGKQTQAAVKLLHHALQDWSNNKVDHHKGAGGMASKKLQQAEQTWAYAKKIEDQVEMLQKALKGENE